MALRTTVTATQNEAGEVKGSLKRKYRLSFISKTRFYNTKEKRSSCETRLDKPEKTQHERRVELIYSNKFTDN